MFFTGYTRNASDILSTQNNLSKESDEEMLKNLDSVKEMGKIAKELLVKGDLSQYGLLMHDHWEKKLKRSPDMCPKEIYNAYKIALENGAIGGKLVGAGGGGFLLFVTQDRVQLRKTMRSLGLKELTFRFENLGVHTITA